jgi:hypothetical protein
MSVVSLFDSSLAPERRDGNQRLSIETAQRETPVGFLPDTLGSLFDLRGPMFFDRLAKGKRLTLERIESQPPPRRRVGFAKLSNLHLASLA